MWPCTALNVVSPHALPVSVLSVFCHPQGVLHRDLKLANIFRSSKGIIRTGEQSVPDYQEVAVPPGVTSEHPTVNATV
jgi:serine/threonine protein kinase